MAFSLTFSLAGVVLVESLAALRLVSRRFEAMALEWLVTIGLSIVASTFLKLAVVASAALTSVDWRLIFPLSGVSLAPLRQATSAVF